MPATGVDVAVGFSLLWHRISHGEKASSSAVETIALPVFSDRLSASIKGSARMIVSSGAKSDLLGGKKGKAKKSTPPNKNPKQTKPKSKPKTNKQQQQKTNQKLGMNLDLFHLEYTYEAAEKATRMFPLQM